MAFKHINANEQILDGSIGTSLLADGSVTSAKLAFDAITSSNFLVNSNIDFNNFQALEFRIENINFFPVAGNPGRLIWRTDLRDLFVDSDFQLNIVSTASIPLQIGIIADSTHMSVNSTAGLSIGDSIIQGGFPFSQVEILETINSTLLVVSSTAGINVGNQLVQANASTLVTGIIDATHMTVANTNGFQPDVATVSTPYIVAVVQTIIDSTHLVVDSTAGFVGRAIVYVDFGIVTTEGAGGTHLTVDNSIAMAPGDIITQGVVTTTITSVTDLTHIVVADTTGLTVGIATVQCPVDVLAVTDATHLTVTNTTGFGPGDPIIQGAASTTVISVINSTHLVVGSASGFALNAAKDSTIVVDSTANVVIGMYLNQQTASTVIINVTNMTHLAVADTTGFVSGPAFSGNWVSINEGANVTSIRADGNPQLHGNVQFLSGTNTHLAQLGQTIAVNVPAAGATGELQFNNDVSNDLGADSNLFWDNTNKRLGVGTSTPATALDVTGAATLRSTLDVSAIAKFHNGVSGGIQLIDSSNSTQLYQSGTQLIINPTAGVGMDVNYWTHINVGTNSFLVDASGTFAAQTSAVVQIDSTTQGFLIPRLTTVQRDAIVSPVKGLMIFNTDSNLFNFYTGTVWLPVGSPVGNIGDVQFNAGGGLFGANVNFFWDNTNVRLGIGNAVPAFTLDVTGIAKASVKVLTPEIDDITSVQAFNITSRTAYDTAAVLSIDWGVNRRLYTSVGLTKPVLDWQAGQLIDTASGTPSVNWFNRVLFDTGFTILLDWSVPGVVTIDGALGMSTHQIHNVVDPTVAQDAATKNYVDGGAHTVGGSTTQIQYNNNGVFAGATGLTTDGVTLFTQTISGNNTLTLYPGSDSLNAIRIDNAAKTSTIVSVDTTNLRVGINTTTPVTTFDVTGTGHFTSDITVDTKVSANEIKGRTGDLALQPFIDSITALKVQNAAGSLAVFTIDTTTNAGNNPSGRVAIAASPNGTFTLTVGGSSNAIYAAGDITSTTRLNAPASFIGNMFTNRIAPETDGISAIVIQDSGFTTTIVDIDSTNHRVGINNTAPGFALDVTGDNNVSGNVIAGSNLISQFWRPVVSDTSYINLQHTQVQVVLNGTGYMTVGGAGTDFGGTVVSTGSSSMTNNHVTTNSVHTDQITDPSVVQAIDVTNRRLYDSAGFISLDWLNRLLKASDASTSINYNTPGTVDILGILDMTGHSIIHVIDPVNPQDAATKAYVDATSQGLTIKTACQAATIANLSVTAAGSQVGKTLTATANGALVVDGYTVLTNDRILVKNQTTGSDNGIYTVTQTGDATHPFILTRATDFDNSATVKSGDFIFINNGTVNASSGWVLSTPDPITVDTTSLTFTQFSGAGEIIAGNGLTKTGNQLDIHPADASLITHIGDIAVQRDPAGAVGLSGAGIAVNTDGTYIGISGNNVSLLNPTSHTVAGANTQVQFNNSGAFGASADFTWDGSNLQLGASHGLVLQHNPTTAVISTNGITPLFIGSAAAIQLNAGSGENAILYLNTGVSASTAVGIGTLTPDASAALDVTSTVTGFLPPRMTTTQKNAIASPATGLIVFDTTLGFLQIYNGTTWTSVQSVINFVTREVPTGAINGSNVTFTLAHTPVVGSEEIFLNGLLQNAGAGNDYTISGATITFTTAPLTGDVLLVTYRY
ncbi:MAG: beta strand repeat-containing protein [bacterium]